MIPTIIKEMEQHTNIVFKLVEILASSPIWLGICGAGLTIAPIMGIMIIHRQPNSDGKNHD